MVRICDGKELPKGDRSAVYMLRTFGGEAHEIWNVADPANPVLITRIGGLKDTHKNWWECDTGIAFLVSGAPDWRTRRMTQVYDLSDPAHPVKIRDFGLPGQEPGSTGAVPTELHGPISTGPAGNRVYFGYGTNKGGFLQIVDREKLLNGPKEPTPDNLRLPEISRHADVGLQRRAYGVSDEGHADRGIRQGQGRQDPRHRDDRRRGDPERMQRAAADGVVRRRHGREPADDDLELHRAGSQRHRSANGAGGSARIPPTRAWRRSTTRRWRSSPSSMPACARSTFAIPIIPKEVGYFIPSITAATDKRCVTDRRQGPLQGRDPDQQCRDRRARLYLHRRPRQYRPAYSGIDRPARAVAGLP